MIPDIVPPPNLWVLPERPRQLNLHVFLSPVHSGTERMSIVMSPPRQKVAVTVHVQRVAMTNQYVVLELMELGMSW